MARRHVGKLHAPSYKKCILADKESVGPLAPKNCEGRVDLAAGAGVENLDLQSHRASSRFHIPQRGLRIGRIRRIYEHGYTSHSGHHLSQELQPLCRQLITEKIDSRQVAAWPGEAGHKTQLHRVFADAERQSGS